MKTKNYFKKAVLLFLVCSAQIIMAQVPSYVPISGLVGYWPFDGNTNDASVNGNNGTNNGATLTTDRFGNANSAYTYNGTSSYINVPNSTSLQFNGEITISTWFNAAIIPVGATASTSYILSKGADGGTPYSWTSILDSNGPGICMWNNNNLNNCNTITPSQFPISLNTWYNVVYTYDGTSAKAYINGQLKSSVAATYTTFSNTYDLKFGRRHTSGLPYFFSGKLDDIGIWNRALSAQEITNMYNQVAIYSDNCNAVSGSLVNGLVAYYPFCGNANDQSGHGYDGTVNGATLTNDRFGNANAAYSFNGISNYIQLPNNSSITPANITVSLWSKILSNKVNQRLIRQRASGFDISYNMQAQYGTTATNKLSSDLYTSSTLNYNPIINNVVNDQQWHQIIFSYDGLNFKIYIDSLLAYQNSSNGAGAIYYNNSGNGFTIGRDGDNPDWYLNGLIDDVGIWNRALTTQEVTQLYNQNQCFTNTTITDTLVINVGQMSYTTPIAYANNITIAPNPASTQVTISFNNITDLNGGTIKIINSLGQQVATTPITTSGTNTSMTLSTWGGSGLYFVQIINPQGQIVDIKKILLQ